MGSPDGRRLAGASKLSAVIRPPFLRFPRGRRRMIVAVVMRKQLPSLPDQGSGTPAPDVERVAGKMAVPRLTTNQTDYQKPSNNLANNLRFSPGYLRKKLGRLGLRSTKAGNDRAGA